MNLSPLFLSVTNYLNSSDRSGVRLDSEFELRGQTVDDLLDPLGTPHGGDVVHVGATGGVPGRRVSGHVDTVIANGRLELLALEDSRVVLS